MYKFVWTPFILSLSVVDGNEILLMLQMTKACLYKVYFVQVKPVLISEYVLINDMFLTTSKYSILCVASSHHIYIFSLLDFYPLAQASRVM